MGLSQGEDPRGEHKHKHKHKSDHRDKAAIADVGRILLQRALGLFGPMRDQAEKLKKAETSFHKDLTSDAFITQHSPFGQLPPKGGQQNSGWEAGRADSSPFRQQGPNWEASSAHNNPFRQQNPSWEAGSAHYNPFRQQRPNLSWGGSGT